MLVRGEGEIGREEVWGVAGNKPGGGGGGGVGCADE